MTTCVRFIGCVQIVAPPPLLAVGGAVASVTEPEEPARGGYGLGRKAHWALAAPTVPYARSFARVEIRETGDFHREAARLFADTLEVAAALSQGAPPLTQVTLHALTDAYLQGMLALLCQGPAPTSVVGGDPPTMPEDQVELTGHLARFSATYLDRVRVLCSKGE